MSYFVSLGPANLLHDAFRKAGFDYKSGESFFVFRQLPSSFKSLSVTWPSDLGELLKEQNATLDAVIDSAGGDILNQTSRLMKAGGKLVCYGM